MEASIVDLRYHMHDVLKALDRKEEVTILFRGKIKGKILPVTTRTKKNPDPSLFWNEQEKN